MVRTSDSHKNPKPKIPLRETLRRREVVLQGQKQALESAVDDGSLSEALDVLTMTAERQSRDPVIASILLVSPDGDRLVSGSGPNLPAEYSEAISGLPIGPRAGSCGAAAFHKKEVVVSDIDTDPLWDDYRHLVAPYGLKACWSVPVFSSRHDVLATFALYYKEPREPRDEDRTAVELLSRTAGLAIEWCLEMNRRREAEAALSKSDQHLRALMAATTDVLFRMSADWNTMRTLNSESFLLDTTVETDDWREQYIPPEDRTLVQEAIDQAIKSKAMFRLEHRVIQRDGTTGWSLTRAIPILDDEEGNIVEWYGVATDITSRKLDEDRLRQVLQFMPEIVWSADPEGYHDFFNERWYEFTGLAFDDTKGDKWIRVVHPDDADHAKDVWQRCLKTGEVYEIEYRMRRHDGEWRWMLGRSMPLPGKDGAIERWYGTCTDIHDQRTMAENLEMLVEERTKELKRSNEDLQQFAHVASHDLKEPVRKIQFFANLIDDKLDDLPESVKRNIRKIQKSVGRIASMIEGVLLYSALDGAHLTLEDIDLNMIMSDVEDDLELVIAEKQAVITYSGLPLIRGVPTLMSQLFYNLIHNSLKFCSQDRTPKIVITSRIVEEDEKAFHEVVIEDNGIGFSDIYAESIFTTFIRLHAKDDYEGTGLGLALCKKIVERHGGSITARGTEGSGAVFQIRLPR